VFVVLALTAGHLGLALSFGSAACNGNEGDSDGGEDAYEDVTVDVVTICDDFTEAGARCSMASPFICFPMCEAGGCSCRPTATGPRWACTTDLSCVPDCAPIDDSCAAGGSGEDADATSGPRDAGQAEGG
jgi:hypothetical protein